MVHGQLELAPTGVPDERLDSVLDDLGLGQEDLEGLLLLSPGLVELSLVESVLTGLELLVATLERSPDQVDGLLVVPVLLSGHLHAQLDVEHGLPGEAVLHQHTGVSGTCDRLDLLRDEATTLVTGLDNVVGAVEVDDLAVGVDVALLGGSLEATIHPLAQVRDRDRGVLLELLTQPDGHDAIVVVALSPRVVGTLDVGLDLLHEEIGPALIVRELAGVPALRQEHRTRHTAVPDLVDQVGAFLLPLRGEDEVRHPLGSESSHEVPGTVEAGFPGGKLLNKLLPIIERNIVEVKQELTVGFPGGLDLEVRGEIVKSLSGQGRFVPIHDRHVVSPVGDVAQILLHDGFDLVDAVGVAHPSSNVGHHGGRDRLPVLQKELQDQTVESFHS